MEQNTPQQHASRNKFLVGCLIIAVIGITGLVILAGGAYYFGLFTIPITPAPVLVATEQPATETAPTPAPVAATETIQPTEAVVLEPPKIDLYDLNFNVQYPALSSLADDNGNVTILPNQPTILDLSWCAKNESTLSKITSLLDLTVLINDLEIPVSSFNISKYQTTLEVVQGKKDPAVCNRLIGLVRNWSEGEYTVKLSLRATTVYDDGWKQHAVDEVQEYTYTVKVTSLSSFAAWDRCREFENIKTELVFLDPTPNEPLGFYLKFASGVPGYETDISGDPTDLQYTATIGEASSDKVCTFQQGYKNRLYCKVKLLSNYAKTVKPVSVFVNGCSWPVYYNSSAVLP